MRKSSYLSSHYLPGTSRPHSDLDTLRRQMADSDLAYARGDVLLALREARRASGRRLTREQAAAEIGVTAKTLYSWEILNGPIKLANAEKAATFYKVDLDSITTRDPSQLGALA